MMDFRLITFNKLLNPIFSYIDSNLMISLVKLNYVKEVANDKGYKGH